MKALPVTSVNIQVASVTTGVAIELITSERDWDITPSGDTIRFGLDDYQMRLVDGAVIETMELIFTTTGAPVSATLRFRSPTETLTWDLTTS